MIYLYSGQPGHGKTTRAISECLKLKAKGRDVYVNGMKELDYGRTGFIPLEDPREWEGLPDGSVIVIDEAYRVFPNRSAQSKVPPFVESLARHRHRGFDFILICQDPAKQLDPFIRGLVDQHTHVRRKFGTHSVVLKTWDHFQSDPLKKDARIELWRLDKNTFDLHVSATQHTVKRSIPWWIFAVVPLLAFVIGVGWHIASGRFLSAPEDVADGGGGKPGGQPGATPATLTTDAYIGQFVPRVTGQPWTAPAYDDADPVAQPEIYCMSSAVNCNCITEQGTTYYLSEKLCRTMARHGNYNPNRPPPREDFRVTDEDDSIAAEGGQRPMVPGVTGEPSVVGTSAQGQVWGDAPETLRPSGM